MTSAIASWVRLGALAILGPLVGCSSSAVSDSSDADAIRHSHVDAGRPLPDASGGVAPDASDGHDAGNVGPTADAGGDSEADGGSLATDASGLKSGFRISNGQILAPNGTAWRGFGVGVWDIAGSPVNVVDGGASLAQEMRAAMPGLNLVRVADFSQYAYQSPASLAAFTNDMTSAGVAVVFEDHNVDHTVLTGAALQTESNWYASLAAYYLDNPLVMFQSMNEPGSGESAQMQATYDAIRGTGNNTPIFMEAGYGPGGDPSSLGDTSVFASMHNVGWDWHAYSYSGSTLQSLATVLGIQNAVVSKMQTVHSADGAMPVVALEGGNSVNGSTIDASGMNEVQAAYTNPSLAGFAAWLWNVNNNASAADNLTNAGGITLNSYGQFAAGFLAAGQGPLKP